MTQEEAPSQITMQRTLMAAPFRVVLRGKDKSQDERYLNEAALDVFWKVRELEELLSRFAPDSELCMLNALGARDPVWVEPGTFKVLARCKNYWKWSEGALDITVGPLLRLWDIGGKGRTPAAEELEETMKSVGMDKVLLEEPTLLVAFTADGVELDLGGVGKGTALNECLGLLKHNWNIEDAFLSFGRSTVGVIGGPWKAKLSTPAKRGPAAMEITLKNEVLSVSSLGPRRFVYGAYRDEGVDHVIDPRTGKAKSDVLNVTAIMEDAEAADALTTALTVLGEEKAPEVAARFSARKVIFTRPHENGAKSRILDVGKGSWQEAEAEGESLPKA